VKSCRPIPRPWAVGWIATVRSPSTCANSRNSLR
jgi:hypothetical protein